MAQSGTISKIRYLKRDQLSQEAAIIANYYRDIIESYGIDCTYFMQDTSFPNILNPSLSSYENIIYGENTNMSYSVSSDMIVFMEVEGDIFNVQREGTLPEDYYTMSFMIDDFASTFAQYVGGETEFNTFFDLSGIVSGYTTTLSSDFSIEGLSGNISHTFDLHTGMGSYQPTISYYNDPSYDVPINPYINNPTSFTVSGGDHTCIFNGDYTSSVDGNGDGVINTSLSGSLLYSSLESISRYSHKLRPTVGDYIQLDFPGEDNYEEYEITSVFDRQLTDDGVNPLLHKYIYKCDIIRRVPNHEEVFGDDTFMEKTTSDLKEIMEDEQCIRATVSDEIDSYDDDVDDVYGGYGLDCYGNEMT